MILSKWSNENTILRVLDSIQRVLNNGEYFLSNEEDERIARIIILILIKDLLPRKSIYKWIEDLEKDIDPNYSPRQYISKVNTKNFIRCLYFSLMHIDKTKDSTVFLFNIEEKLNKFIKLNKKLITE